MLFRWIHLAGSKTNGSPHSVLNLRQYGCYSELGCVGGQDKLTIKVRIGQDLLRTELTFQTLSAGVLTKRTERLCVTFLTWVSRSVRTWALVAYKRKRVPKTIALLLHSWDWKIPRCLRLIRGGSYSVPGHNISQLFYLRLSEYTFTWL